MEGRKLELTLVSAQNLPDVRSLGLMKVYAKISLKGLKYKTTKKSPVDYTGELNPTWNFVVDYTVSESTVQRPGVNLTVRLMCKRTLGDRLIGEVRIAVKDLFDMGLKSPVSYEVAGGRLNLLYSFSERMMVRRPSGSSLSGWREAIETVGFLVVVGGAMLLLGGDHSDHDDPEPARGSRDVRVEEHDGGEPEPAHEGSRDVRVVVHDGGDQEPARGSRDVSVEVHDGDVFYDAAR